jgi:hypothetical protein
MIGVAVSPNDWGIVREFFELFKTPWEPAAPDHRYRAVISTVGLPTGIETELLVAYGSAPQALDEAAAVDVAVHSGRRRVNWAGDACPLYRPSCTFERGGASASVESQGLAYRTHLSGMSCHRVGYDLMEEVGFLLTEGQPPEQAGIPALDLHIEGLRRVLCANGVSFVEVPPRPAGFPFICCLTHDIDFAGIRRHGLDRTLAGFTVRATIGTAVDLLTGRRTLAEATRNWASALTLPLVMLGALPDPWRPFENYDRADGLRASTFFVIPRRDHAGISPRGQVDATRAVRYEAGDVREDLVRSAAKGREIALHGLDAWRDATDAGRERADVAGASRRPVSGVRMHWLYFDSDAAVRLEEAGFDYDSTSGYNEAVGYRAGTSQAFMPLGCHHLLELPLHVMDTALFYPDRLGLSPDGGLARCLPVVGHAAFAGGAVVVNWHDRSLVAERQWGRAYTALLAELDGWGPWYATCRAAVDWFRWRRAITFASDGDGGVRVASPAASPGAHGATVTVVRGRAGLAEQHHLAAAADVTVRL